jgi:S-adenosylmethionine:tRNA ribosyltransferase-isomerase
MKKEDIFIKDYTYELPVERIAKHPLTQRDQSKLLVYQNGRIREEQFYKLPDLIPGGATLVLNNTRVIEARILFQKPTGGVIEIFCLEPYQQSIETSLLQTGHTRWDCLIGGASKWKAGQVLEKKILVNNEPGPSPCPVH